MNRAIALMIMAVSIMTAYAFPVRITSWDVKNDVKLLNSLNISVDAVDQRNGTITAYAWNDTEYQKILAAGFNATPLPDPAPELAAKLNAIRGDMPPTRDEYYSIDQYNTFMIQTAAQYPNICSLVQAGSSVQNRPIYFLKISDNVGVAEAEPEFKYISSIHGDEVLGYDMLIRLIQLLTSEYGTTPRITNIVNNTEIWICPMMNPDGFVLGQRYNAAGVDINRNFPMPTGDQHPDDNAWTPETVAIMNFGAAHHFQLSANLHGGALVMNYPWDYTYALAPDNSLLIQASLAFAQPYTAMYNSSEFPQGITNGAAWYVITGSMQDWNYGFTDCMDITAEIGTVKWPPASQLASYWNQMRESYLAYMEFVQRGIHGLVTDASGTPLDATITVQGNIKPMHTDPALGDYHRLLLPGTYTVTASAPGYISQTAVITIPAGGSVQHDFVLQTAGLASLSGTVRNMEGIGQAQLTVTLGTTPPSTATTATNGSFAFPNIYEGTYTLSVSGPSGIIFKKDIQVSSSNTHQSIILPAAMLYDEFNSGLANWTGTGAWGIGTVSGDPALTDSPTGNYGNNINTYARLNNPLNFTNVQDPVLSFRTRYFLESGYDFVYVEASSNGTTWTELANYTGSLSSWTYMTIPLSAFAGGTCHLRFRLDSDQSVNLDGFYVDNLRIFGYASNVTVYGDVDGTWSVDSRDAKAVLEYSAGLDPLPQTDPLPWEGFRITAADVDTDSEISAYDAHQILRYANDSSFRFEAQTGVPITAPNPQMTISGSNGILLSFGAPGNVQSINLQIQPQQNLQTLPPQWDPGTNTGIYAFNAASHKIAWAGYSSILASVHVPLETALSSVTCVFDVNGSAGSQVINLGSPSDDPAIIPAKLSLDGNYPNPFNPSTTIRWAVPSPGPACIEIYNTRGQMVKQLVKTDVAAGWQNTTWDGTDSTGRAVASGVYLYRLTHAGSSLTRRMLLNK